MAIEYLEGTEEFSEQNNIHNPQVYYATHDGEGNSLPHLRRSFISFSYGNKPIEDFGLIATFKDRLNKNAYSEFEDDVTEYSTLHGQYFWGYNFKKNQLAFTLSTDGITENELQNFISWFVPGVERELILSEHPNRAIMARVALQPSIFMIPFEHDEIYTIGSTEYNVKTTLYKGEINITFHMDDPFWYAKKNYFTINDIENNNEGANNLKTCLEDNIPVIPDNTNINKILYIAPSSFDDLASKPIVGWAQTDLAVLLDDDSLGPPDYDTTNNCWYLFYSGNAPSYPLVSFRYNIKFSENGLPYIIGPKNSHTSGDNYSFISFDDNMFKFTVPSLLNGYNQALDIFNDISIIARVDMENKIKADINEYYSRGWALYILNEVCTTDGVDVHQRSVLTSRMKELFYQEEPQAVFTIDSKNGIATGLCICRTIITDQNGKTGIYIQYVTENVGDMISSQWPIITKTGELSNGQISISDNIPLKGCTHITTNDKDNIDELRILFKNMYL